MLNGRKRIFFFFFRITQRHTHTSFVFSFRSFGRVDVILYCSDEMWTKAITYCHMSHILKQQNVKNQQQTETSECKPKFCSNMSRNWKNEWKTG